MLSVHVEQELSTSNDDLCTVVEISGWSYAPILCQVSYRGSGIVALPIRSHSMVWFVLHSLKTQHLRTGMKLVKLVNR